MNLGIDISQIVYKGSGVARYTEGIVNAILQYDTGNTWHFYFSSLRRNLSPILKEQIRGKGFILHEYRYPPSFLALWFNNLHFISKRLPHLYQIPENLDWFITSDWTEPYIECKKMTIIHDLVFKKYPETLAPQIISTQQSRLSHVVKESSLILCVSHATENDLLNEYDIDRNKIIVNYTGVEHSHQIKTQGNIFSTYNIRKPFILTVGKLEPRKNIARLIEAFKKSKTTAQLVIVGAEGWGETNYTSENEDITFLGFVSDSDLSELYKHALFFIYPSLYEGFGYPIIEAMLEGCPVATSNTSSMKEIAEGYAELFDPENTAEISNAIQTLFDNEKLRDDLRKKGLKHSERFTWKRYYNTLITELSKRS